MPPKKSKGRKKRSAEEEEVPDIPQPPSPTDEQNEAVEEYSEQPAEPPFAGRCGEDKTKVPQLQPTVEQELADFYEGNPIFITKVEATLKTRRRRSVCCKSRLRH